jgi:acyl-CoA thioesterase I
MKRLLLKMNIIPLLLAATLLTVSCHRSRQIETLILKGQNMNWKSNFVSFSDMPHKPEIAGPSDYLRDIKAELQKEWPANRTVNLVFHGHSVPAGYFKTPVVNTMAAYPHLFLKKLKEFYPYAVVNAIVTAIGGENSEAGAKRFESDVLIHNPDVILIDYALNDRGPGLAKAYEAWDKMIKLAKAKNIKIILLTPSPDQSVNYGDPENELKKHTDQIRLLAAENQVALADTYQAFQFLYTDKVELGKFMSQVNHPNEHGHELIAMEIMKWFR